MTQSAGAAEYTNCISAEGLDFHRECTVFDTKQSEGETPVVLELWGVLSIPSLTSLSCLLTPRVVAPDKVQIELN